MLASLLRRAPLRASLSAAPLGVTVEPCVLCAAALARAGVRRIVFGCANEKFGGCGTVMDVAGEGGGGPQVTGGVRAAEAVALLKAFYARPNVRTTATASAPAKT